MHEIWDISLGQKKPLPNLAQLALGSGQGETQKNDCTVQHISDTVQYGTAAVFCRAKVEWKRPSS